MIELHGVTSKLPDGRTLFSDVNVNLLSKTCVGIVGPNGAGKSTFLKLLAGQGNFEGRVLTHFCALTGYICSLPVVSSYPLWTSVQVSVREGTKVTYLAQEPDLNDELTVRDNVAAGAGDAAALLKRFEEVNEAMGTAEGDAMDALLDEQAQLLISLDDCGAWDLDNRVDRAMAELSLPPPEAIVGSLSGGEKRRVALCRALMEVLSLFRDCIQSGTTHDAMVTPPALPPSFFFPGSPSWCAPLVVARPRTCSSSTSRPTTWTPTPCPGSRASSGTSRGPS